MAIFTASFGDIVPFVNHIRKILLSDVMEYISFITSDKDSSWWYEGTTIEFSTPTPGKILSLLVSYPDITLDKMSDVTGINRSALQKHIGKLAEKNYISRPQGKKRGWIVNAKNTLSYGNGFHKSK